MSSEGDDRERSTAIADGSHRAIRRWRTAGDEDDLADDGGSGYDAVEVRRPRHGRFGGADRPVDAGSRGVPADLRPRLLD